MANNTGKILLYGAIAIGVGFVAYKIVNAVAGFGKTAFGQGLGDLAKYLGLAADQAAQAFNNAAKAANNLSKDVFGKIILGAGIFGGGLVAYELYRRKNNNTKGPSGPANPVTIINNGTAQSPDDQTSQYAILVNELSSLENIPIQDVGLAGVLAGFASLSDAVTSFYNSDAYGQLSEIQQVAFDASFAPFLGLTMTQVQTAPVPVPVPTPSPVVYSTDMVKTGGGFFGFLDSVKNDIASGLTTFAQALSDAANSATHNSPAVPIFPVPAPGIPVVPFVP